jgi:hypothetical protein
MAQNHDPFGRIGPKLMTQRLAHSFDSGEDLAIEG